MDPLTKLAIGAFVVTFAALAILPRLLSKPLARLLERRDARGTR